MNDIRKLIAWCKDNSFTRVEWTIYYNSDENNIDTICAYRGDELIGTDLMYDLKGDITPLEVDVEDLAWALSAGLEDDIGDTGIFTLDVEKHKVAKTSQAWLPKPELEIEPIDEPKWITVAQFEKA